MKAQSELYAPQIIKAIREDLILLAFKTREYEKLISAKAEADRDYKIEVRKQILLAKSDGQSITLIPKLVEGKTSVANLKFKADVADGVMKACNESIKNLRASVDAGRSILSQKKEEMKG